MSDKPKSKDTNHLFGTEPNDSGTLPDDTDPQRPREDGDTAQVGVEPIFELDIDPITGPISGASSIHVGTSEPQLGAQLDRLKTQVENLSSFPSTQNLNPDQMDVLKRYITLKEAEVRDLKDQHRQYQSHLKRLGSEIENLATRNRDALSEIEVLKRRDQANRDEKYKLQAKHDEEIVALKKEYEDRLKQGGHAIEDIDSLRFQKEEWRQKIKEDLKRIKLKERELENKHELLKRDMQALLDSKDRHVLELKKKNDALELEMETLEERLRRANSILAAIDAKKKRLIETFRLALSLLENIDQEAPREDSDSRKVG